MEKLIEILNSLRPGVDFTAQTNIIEEGLLDSVTIVRLITLLEDEYDIEFSVTDLVPENFRSVETIMNLVQRLED